MSSSIDSVNVDDILSRLDAQFPALMEELKALVAIPSVSSLPEHAADLARSAEHVRDRFTDAGLDARVVSVTTPEGIVGKPAVLARSAHIEGAPTVLLYAHHDVQPAGDVSRWASDPFTAEVRGERIYGRGTSDDGAGIIVHLGALRLLSDQCPLNVVVFIEGEEEIGSPAFSTFLETHADELAADVIVVADSDNWKVGEPAITTTLRGNVRFDMTVSVADHAVHSGMFGGPLLDAVTTASILVSSFFDEEGNVAIKGLGGHDEADVVWDEEEFRQAAGVLPGVKLAGTGDLAARTWTKPALSVIGWDTTSVADAANSLIPSTTLKISMRSVPGTDPALVMEAVRAHIEEHNRFGARIELSSVELGPGYQADCDAPATHLLRDVLTRAWGVEPVDIGVGGSIPFISEFQESFPEAAVVVTGVEDPMTNAHSEDESQSIPDLRRAVLAEALFLAALPSTLAGQS